MLCVLNAAFNVQMHMDEVDPLSIMTRHDHALLLCACRMHGRELRFSFWSAADMTVYDLAPFAAFVSVLGQPLDDPW